jgi:predicted  nucleic acid-binding Zn-ribbon protein
MQSRFIRYGACLLAVLIGLSVFSLDAGAQRRRKRRTRRHVTKPVVQPVVTNPAIAPPGAEQAAGSDGEKIISTADQGTSETEQNSEDAPLKKNTSAKPTSAGDMQQTINQLSNQVDKLNDKLSQMQQNDLTLLNMERLTRAEQRAESLRAQQIDVESKLADAQAKEDQVEYLLRPENIEQASGYGTTHPEEAREARRHQLENEKARLLAQIKILETSRDRLQTSLVAADAEVDSLRQKMEQQAQQDTSGATTTEPRPMRRPKPE